MKNNKINSIHILTVIIILLTIITTGMGLFYITDGQPFDFVNQYGDTVKIYGNGLYANDSHFAAPIFRGTDLAILVVGIPVLIIALILDIKKNTLKRRLFLTSIISIFTYYSICISLGAKYNILHLVYISLLAASFFALILSIRSLDEKELADNIGDNLPTKGINIFLVLTGIALVVAWLPDIIGSLINGTSLALIEVYTTSLTYVLDMGIIAPVAFICIFELKKKTGIGYILLSMILAICSIIGIILPLQSLFQLAVGIEIPIPALITKIASFVVLAVFAIYFKFKLFRNFKKV